ncbi:hypothetical protein NQ318_000791 [Aromia moschata]|uniref:Uncharacterized protein n=1 Tax=Aromia moschata TaxID=1265417 RepID=A0AAV8YSL4_9CUCU|nr:hypothetical protein NQ318_000791 [Aromia moschata]
MMGGNKSAWTQEGTAVRVTMQANNVTNSFQLARLPVAMWRELRNGNRTDAKLPRRRKAMKPVDKQRHCNYVTSSTTHGIRRFNPNIILSVLTLTTPSNTILEFYLVTTPNMI